MSRFIAIDHEMISMDIINSIDISYSFDDEYNNIQDIEEEQVFVSIIIRTKDKIFYLCDFSLFKNKSTDVESISKTIFSYISKNDIAIISDINFSRWTSKVSRYPHRVLKLNKK